MKRLLLSPQLALLFLLSSLLMPSSFAQDGTAQAKAYQLEIGGLSRSYFLYLPEKLAPQSPLLLVLHGYGGNAKDMMSFAEFIPIAEREGFAVCYPQAWLGEDDKHSWNAAYSNPRIDDVAFLTTLAKHLQQTYQLSAQNTFCTGMSNGADMSYILACQAPEVFAAIAPVAGCMMRETFQTCHSNRAVPVFEIHGTADSITHWAGDPAYLPGSGGYLGTEEIVAFWQQKNGSLQALIDTLPNRNQADGSYVIRRIYTDPTQQFPVWLYELVDGKHDWPGSWGNMDVVATEEIWRFFSSLIRPTPPVVAKDERIRLTFFGSSVCKGSGAENERGYARQFFESGAIDRQRYAYVNASTGGDNTLKIEQVGRLTNNLYPTQPDMVVLGLSLSNEGIRSPHTESGRARVVEQFRSRLLALADSLHRRGIQPIIANCYAHSGFLPEQYAATQEMNHLLNTWPYPSINLLGNIDDGHGRWVPGFARDSGHPNTAGHREMALAIVPSLFDAIQQGKRIPRYDWRKNYMQIENPQQQEIITYSVEQEMHGFSMSFRFRAAAEGVLARIYTDTGVREVNIAGPLLSYQTLHTRFPDHTQDWQQVVISHSYANQRTQVALNGSVIGEIEERMVPEKFVFGGTLETVKLKDLSLHRAAWNESEIKDWANQFLIQSSLELYTPLTEAIAGEKLPNVAQSLSQGRLTPGVVAKLVDKPLY